MTSSARPTEVAFKPLRIQIHHERVVEHRRRVHRCRDGPAIRRSRYATRRTDRTDAVVIFKLMDVGGLG